jgi:hypothetical protein
MAFRHQGNGEDQTQIDFVSRPNYVLICPHDATNLPSNIAAIINRPLTDWLKRTPGIRVRAMFPITQDGQTTAVRVWYDSAASTT